MINKNELDLRRNKVFDEMEFNSIMILFSGTSKIKSEDQYYDFNVNRNFYYLSGIEQENSVLVLFKTFSDNKIYLFIDEKDENIEKWIGIKLSKEEANNISGIENILYRNSFEGTLKSLIEETKDKCEIYIDLSNELKIDDNLSTNKFKEDLTKKYSNISIKNLWPILTKLRMIKTSYEVELIKNAIKTTELGIKNILKILKTAKYEYNLRNIFEYAISEDQKSTTSFPTIVASGKNAIILHYPNACDLLNKDDLTLFDLGATNLLYCADISRTFPNSGTFSELQKKIYNIVLQCNKAIINFIKPGVTLQDVWTYAKDFLANECFDANLIKNKEDIKDVYYHSCSHHLGLDTHDVSFKDLPLEEGNIITVEPGLYFKEFGIGIRIEDDVLVTKDGSLNLSSEIIKEIKDIENVLKSN